MNSRECLPCLTPKERSLLCSSRGLNGSLETLGENEGIESFFSSVGEEEVYTKLRAQMTLLPSLLQPIHSNAITQTKGQKCPSTSKEMAKSKTLARKPNNTVNIIHSGSLRAS